MRIQLEEKEKMGCRNKQTMIRFVSSSPPPFARSIRVLVIHSFHLSSCSPPLFLEKVSDVIRRGQDSNLQSSGHGPDESTNSSTPLVPLLLISEPLPTERLWLLDRDRTSGARRSGAPLLSRPSCMSKAAQRGKAVVCKRRFSLEKKKEETKQLSTISPIV